MDLSNIKSIIETHAQGDQEFMVDFADLCRINYLDFIEGMKSGVSEKNIDRMKKVTHKIKSLNKLFALNELETLLSFQKENENYFIKNSNKLDEVVGICNRVIEELKTV